MAFVYLLHFDRPYPGGQWPQHYLGVCRDIRERLAAHQAGSSKSCLTRAVRQAGIGIELAAQWEYPEPKDAFDRERVIKAQKRNYRHLCPVCKATPRLV